MSANLVPIKSEKAPAALGPYSQAMMIPSQRLIFVSGQLPIDQNSGQLMQGDIQAMTRCILDYIQAILEASGSSLEAIVRVEIFCTDIKRDFQAINAEYGRYFNQHKPARQTIQVAALPLNSPLEISCIAIAPAEQL